MQLVSRPAPIPPGRLFIQTLTWDVDAAAVAGNSDAYISHLREKKNHKLNNPMNWTTVPTCTLVYCVINLARQNPCDCTDWEKFIKHLCTISIHGCNFKIIIKSFADLCFQKFSGQTKLNLPL